MGRVCSAFLFLGGYCLLIGLLAFAETFPVCQRCNCAALPNPLSGRVVDVPASLVDTDWLTFNEQIASNQTVVLLFRSVEPTCNVEIKLKSINSTVQFIVYPGGRSNPTIVTTDLGPVRSFCSIFADSVSLGPSIISNGTELALAFIKYNTQLPVAVNIQLLYRQHCPNTRNVGGTPLASPPVNGAKQSVQLVNSYMGGDVPGASSTILVWSVAPPIPNCSIEVTFTKSTKNSAFALNEANPVFVGVTHRVNQGQEAIIRLLKPDPLRAVDAAITVEYRAVECGSPVNVTDSLSTFRIASWNNVVKPLTRVAVPVGSNPFQTVNFTFPSDGAQQLGIWFLSGLEPGYLPFTSWSSNNRWDWRIAQVYIHDFNAQFSSMVTLGTVPFSFLIMPNSASSVSFKYAFLPAAALPTLVAIASSSAATELVLTQDMIVARRIYIKAANESCAVAVWRPDTWNSLSKIRILPFGFNSTLNDALDEIDDYFNEDKYVGSGVFQYPTRSVGPIMGIQFYGWMDLTGNQAKLLYQMVCPTQLSMVLPQPEKWRYVDSPAATFLLPQPPVLNGKQCWAEISSVSSILPRDRDVRLLVICLQSPMRTELLSGHKTTSIATPCNGTLHVDPYPFAGSWPPGLRKDTTLFAYRVQCEGDSVGVDDGLAPIEPLKKVFVADDKWKALDTKEYEYEDHNYAGHRNTWMLQAKNPNCRVEVSFAKTADLSAMNIFEDFMIDLDGPVKDLDDNIRIKNLHYVSCDRRVFLVGLRPGLGKHNGKYRQVCGKGKPGFGCSQNVTVEAPSDGKWQTLQATSNGNLNQLFHLHYHINPPAEDHTSERPSKVLELEFTSTVLAETWSGGIFIGRGYAEQAAEIHGIRINDKFRAIAGKQYQFKESVDIAVEALARAKRGDHIFTVRYRWIDVKQVRQDIRLGEVLNATKKAKALDFKFPQQFSRERLKQIIHQGQFEYEDNYGDKSGDFPVWLFRHLYTIKPSHTSCRVALQITKMDIGSGFIMGPMRNYNNEQHRLSVIYGNVGSQPIPLQCASDVLGQSSNQTLCARMDRVYLSAPGAPLRLLFRSADFGEYEYEDLDSQVGGSTGVEISFGTGWAAKYQEICDATTAGAPTNIQPTLVKAKPLGKANKWQRDLPGMLKFDKDRLFRDKRWLIKPQQQECEVQYVLTTNKRSREPLPFAFQVGNIVTMPRTNRTFTSSNVTIIQLGASKARPLTVKYRQICTQAPTAKPTSSPTKAPTVAESAVGSRRDGETCNVDRECASGVCSKTLLRCTTKTCSTQCSSRNSSQSLCQSYAANGCSCSWSLGTRTCLSVV